MAPILAVKVCGLPVPYNGCSSGTEFSAGFERPVTPTSDDEPATNDPPKFISRPREPADEEEEPPQDSIPRKKGGYDSRIEQLLYENPDLQIIITDAGKNMESGGSYITYTIRTGVSKEGYLRYFHHADSR